MVRRRWLLALLVFLVACSSAPTVDPAATQTRAVELADLTAVAATVTTIGARDGRGDPFRPDAHAHDAVFQPLQTDPNRAGERYSGPDPDTGAAEHRPISPGADSDVHADNASEFFPSRRRTARAD